MLTDDLLRAMWRERASAILRTDDRERARAAMDAAIRGGFRIVELTTSVPDVFELIAGLAERSDLVVGCGTILEPAEAREAVRAGARYLVSPVLDESVIATATSLGVPMMPGCSTPTEMLSAHRAGAALVKLFPAPAGGPAFVRAVLAPMPFLRIVPTSGDLDNAVPYLEAGAFSVGFVGGLFDPADLAAGRFGAVEDRARRLLDRVRSVVRPSEPPLRA